MPYKYATVAETISDTMSEIVDDAEQLLTIGRLIESASNFVDKFCDRPEGYFAAVDPVDPEADPLVYPTTVRRYRGKGNNFLQIGRHVAGTVSVANISDTLFYEHPENGWLFAVDVEGQAGGPYYENNRTLTPILFGNNALYAVTAAWGFAETPSSVVMATKQIVQHIWDRGKGIIGELSPTGFVIERDIPLSARAYLSPWIRREFEVN